MTTTGLPYCQCRAQWFADLGHGEGEQPVTSLVAARALDWQLPVRLGKTCLAWSRRPPLNAPWWSVREHGEGCSVCGWPHPIDGVTMGRDAFDGCGRTQRVASRAGA